MRSIRIGRHIALAVVLSLGSASAVAAGHGAARTEAATAVLDWNVNATTAIVTVAKQPPASAILSYAMVQGAVYDAVNAIDGGHQPYLVAPGREVPSRRPRLLRPRRTTSSSGSSRPRWRPSTPSSRHPWP